VSISAMSTQPTAGAGLTRSVVEEIVREIVRKRLGNGTDPNAPTLVVHSSARHMHVCREDMDKLFGVGTELTPERELYQEGNFAAKEQVKLIGPRGRVISNLRILGPMRKASQIELAYTDAISLGFDLPIRLSGNIEGTPGGLVMGPAGYVELKQGIIRAANHVHMNPQEAAYFGVKQGDIMRLRIGGDAPITFDRVLVRIDPSSRLNVHLDTDEANACGLHLTKDIELIK